MARLNTSDQTGLCPAIGSGLVVGFCTTPEAEAALIAAGVSLIWMRGRMAETLQDAVDWLRGRRGTLVVAEDLRCIATTRKAIFAGLSALDVINVTIKDIRDLAAKPTALIERALIALNAGAEAICRKTRQRRGRKGGTAKGEAAASRRNALIDDEIARRLCHHPKLTWNDRLEILGEFFSMATIKRIYA